MIEGLKHAVSLDIKNITIEGDSQLVISQLSGAYKVKHSNLIPLHRGYYYHYIIVIIIIIIAMIRSHCYDKEILQMRVEAYTERLESTS